MPKYDSNKPLVILQTSFSVSFICAAALGVFFSLWQEYSFSRFLYITYVFFVNNLLMPVSVAVILYYYLHQDKARYQGVSGRLKKIVFLSLASLFLLLIWNTIDFLFHYYPLRNQSSELMMEHIERELFIVFTLALPVSLLISWLYGFINSGR